MISKLGAIFNPEIKVMHINTLSSKKVIIDGYDFLYDSLSRIRQTDLLLFNDLGNPTSHILHLFKYLIDLMENKIQSIFLFCNYISKENNPVIQYKINKIVNAFRKHQKNESESVNELNSSEIDEIYNSLINELITFIRMCGMAAFIAPDDALPQAARLIREEKAIGIISDDYDSLIFGIPYLYRKLYFENNTLQCISLENILKRYYIDYHQFLDVIILTGSIYFSGIKGIGPKKSLKIIKKHKSIEKLIDENIIEELDIQRIRKLFLESPTSEIEINFQPPNLYEIKKYFLTNNFSIYAFENDLMRLDKAYKKLNLKQTKIDKFF